jgi:DNA invertase Pin-like site-specific DNA recombinase
MANQNHTPRVALYCRVSTNNHGQDPETQLLALREYSKARGFEVFEEYVDQGISGSKDSRPALDRLLKDAHRRKFDAVVVVKFDRMARSVKHLITMLETLQALDIQFVSLTEAIDTNTPTGKLLFTVLGAFAELEKDLIRERVLMGLERARRQGKTLGRPKTLLELSEVTKLHAEGLSHRAIATQLGVSHATVGRLLRDGTKTLRI